MVFKIKSEDCICTAIGKIVYLSIEYCNSKFITNGLWIKNKFIKCSEKNCPYYNSCKMFNDSKE